MGDPLRTSDSKRRSEVTAVVSSKKFYRRNAGASCGPKGFPQSAYRHITSLSHGKNGGAVVGHAAIFLLKVAALETIRRVSRSKCPFVWRGLQALQFICYPPFKWIQRWAPFKGLINGVQMFSRPLLVLSVATAFSDELDCNTETVNGANGSQAHSETHSESPSIHSSQDARTSDEAPQCLATENWLMQLHKELDNKGILLPERINEDELRRFFTAANGDFSCLLSSVKKTIRWRETYGILSEQELEMWSSLVFWHGFDVEHRPCLIVRLGLACLKVPSHERPRLTQAVSKSSFTPA
uniref:Uncharacterized protein MANES_04G033100 n=1 Tax=Rhizophora mucronata TaxID=61149 RepID=A0A2P2K3P8_RHIMU